VANAADPPGRRPGSAGDLDAGSFRVRRRAWPPALLCAILGLTWQLLTVHFNYAGNFTALFCTAPPLPIPPQLAAERIYIFQHGGGYDGQYYHYVAHDPLFQTGIGRAIPDPVFRYRRILLPGLAYLLALGQQRFIDASYFACNLIFLFLGAWWLARWLILAGVNRWIAVLYLLVPSTIISLDRMVTDLALTSLCLGLAVYLKTGERTRLYLVIAMAALCRETGMVLAIACCVPPLLQGRFRNCLPFAAALIPASIWYGFLAIHLPRPSSIPASAFYPLRGIAGVLMHPTPYPFPPLLLAAVHAFNYLEIGGILLAVWLSLCGWRKAGSHPVQCACVLWSLLALLLPQAFWDEVYAVARVFSPLLLYRFLETYQGEARLIGRTPMAMVTPRILLQLTPQALAVARALVRAAFTLV
jgi:hypothetical protein